MESLEKIAYAYGQEIINSVKGTPAIESLQLSESISGRRSFLKTASAQDHIESRLIFSPSNKHELKGIDRTSDKIGTHPDFVDLEKGGNEFSYAVNVFVDIKGSTLLAKKLPLQEVKNFKDKVIITAIQIFQALGGHIQRIQGDAVYAVFCWKGIKKSDSIIAALNATALLNYIITENDEKFQEEFGTSLAIRTGIDFGDDEKVLWSKYGILGCSEVTTTSLHTDLACKMQQQAGDNEIIIGRNIREFLDMPSEFYADKTSEVFQKYDYSTMLFKWDRYLMRFPSNPKKVALLSNHIAPYVYITCQYKHEKSNEYISYSANSKALNKNIDLKFELHGFARSKHDKIIWRVENRGREATENDSKNFTMDKYQNQLICLQSTRYTGHHYMVCEAYSNGRRVAEEYFGIYVNDN